MSRRARWVLPVAAVLALALLLLVAGGGDARYVGRVLWHRDSDITDVEWKAHTAVAPTSPRPWPTGECPLADLPTQHAQSLLVVHAGKLVCQWYGGGGAPDRPAPAFSVSKTVLSLLVARSVADGTLPGLDVPVTAAIPELAARDPRFSAITLADLIDMRSGIAFSQDVPFPWVNQDQPAVYYATDLARTVVDRPMITSPPGLFTYNDYAPNLVGLAYQRLTGQLLTGAPLQELWHDLGAQDPVLWCVDDHGFPYHESGMVVTARDLARVGQLLLDKDAAAFTARSLETTGPATTLGRITVGYHNGWWILPGQDLAAMGDHGQIMIVAPATDTIVVRMGDDEGGNIELATTLQDLAHRAAAGPTPDFAIQPRSSAPAGIQTGIYRGERRRVALLNASCGRSRSLRVRVSGSPSSSPPSARDRRHRLARLREPGVGPLNRLFNRQARASRLWP